MGGSLRQRLRHSATRGGRRLGQGARRVCSISTGRAPSSSFRRWTTMSCASSSCRRRPKRCVTGWCSRAQDSAVVVAKRMAEASQEISHWAEYDYVIVNEDSGNRAPRDRQYSRRRASQAEAAHRVDSRSCATFSRSSDRRRGGLPSSGDDIAGLQFPSRRAGSRRTSPLSRAGAAGGSARAVEPRDREWISRVKPVRPPVPPPDGRSRRPTAVRRADLDRFRRRRMPLSGYPTALQARPQLLAPLAESKSGDLSRSLVRQPISIGGCGVICTTLDVTLGGGVNARGPMSNKLHRFGAPLRQHRQPPVYLAARSGGDSLGDLALEHECERLVPGWPGFLR